METVLITCGVCGHRERDQSSNHLMAKIRMWNHVSRKHPEHLEEFRTVVHTDQAEVLVREEEPHVRGTALHQ